MMNEQPTIGILTEDRLRYHLARVASWYKWTRNRRESTFPPMPVVKDMLARPDPPLPRLTRIIEAPMFGKDSELIITPGYHHAAEVYYAPQVNFAISPIPRQPSVQEIEASRDLLLDFLTDFPFISVGERANAISIMLLPFVRYLIDGATLLYLIEKPSPGTGAGLLADLLIYPSLGRPLPAFTEAQDDDEWRKKITAKLREGPTAVLIDNIRKPLDSSA